MKEPKRLYICKFGENIKIHTCIVLLEVCGCLMYRMFYITSLVGLLHPTFVWRFQKAANIPMQGGALTGVPSNAMALLVLIYTWVGWSLVNLKQGSPQPKLPQFDSGQSGTHNLSHTSQELFHCATQAITPTKITKCFTTIYSVKFILKSENPLKVIVGVFC